MYQRAKVTKTERNNLSKSGVAYLVKLNRESKIVFVVKMGLFVVKMGKT